MLEDIVSERAKTALSRCVILHENSTNRHFLLFSDQNAFTVSKLFLGDAGIASEVSEGNDRQCFSQAGLFALKITDIDKFAAFSSHDPRSSNYKQFDNNPIPSATAQQISAMDLRKLAGVFISCNTLAEEGETLPLYKNLLDALVNAAKAQGLSDREFRL